MLPKDLTVSEGRGGATPSEAGFRMPPEWAPYAGCWMAWPCNFYVANDGVVMPAFGDPADSEARDLPAGLFQHRAVVPVPTMELVQADGGIHCVTQQPPVP